MSGVDIKVSVAISTSAAIKPWLIVFLFLISVGFVFHRFFRNLVTSILKNVAFAKLESTIRTNSNKCFLCLQCKKNRQIRRNQPKAQELNSVRTNVSGGAFSFVDGRPRILGQEVPDPAVESLTLGHNSSFDKKIPF